MVQLSENRVTPFQFLLRMGKRTAVAAGTGATLHQVPTHTGLVLDLVWSRYLQGLLARGPATASLCEVHQTLHHLSDSLHHCLQVLPGRGWSIWSTRNVYSESNQQLAVHATDRTEPDIHTVYSPWPGSMLASRSRWGRSCDRLPGSPVRCRAITSSLTL